MDNFESLQLEELGPRNRTLSEKGRESYIQRRDKYSQDVEYLWSMLDSYLKIANSPPEKMQDCLALEQNIIQGNAKYLGQVNVFTSFLKGTRSDESTQDLDTLSQLVDLRKRAVDRALNLLKNKSQYDDKRSIKSHHSGSKACSQSSKHSDAPSVARQKRAKAEAARAASLFAEQQAALERMEAMTRKEAARQKAVMDEEAAIFKTEMNLLQTKKELAIAEAEARVYEMDEAGSQVIEDGPPQLTADYSDRINDYIKQQSQLIDKGNIADVEPDTSTLARLHSSQKPKLSKLSAGAPEFVPTSHDERQGDLVISQIHSLNQDIQMGTQHSTLPNASAMTDNGTSEMTKFLLRKDLLFSQLTQYNDQPGCYHAWKDSFQCVTKELRLSDSEQINLLVKWLGPKSSEQALSIRSSNAGDPSNGLKALWKRLDRRYGSPEMVEASIKKKLESFPKLTNRDNEKLYDFFDLLSEVKFLKKKDEFKTLLAYFDSSTGVRPLVSKLPYGLQEKWSSRAANYASKHSIAFPPFEEFHAFFEHICDMRNNPGFRPIDLDNPTQKGDSAKITHGTKPKVNVRRTELTNQKDDQPESQPLSNCILHNTKHTLDECRGFKFKSIEERKKLLRQHNICFKCCASDRHVSRDCKAKICCKDCGSKQHTTALHVNRPSPRLPPEAAANHGGEFSKNSKRQNEEDIRAKCTEICKGAHGKSCAKILPVNVYNKDNPNKILRLYAIIDDQSNRSLALPSLFDFFDVRSEPESYTLNTCSGRVITSGRRGSDFIVESINGDVELELPTLIECGNIPDDKNEIATPEVVKFHEHLNDLIGSIKPIDRKKEIMLLIGRDLAEAHYVLDQRIGHRGAPYAQRLKLGWVVIGEACLDKQHAPDNVNVSRTHVSLSGQPTALVPCHNYLEVREQLSNPVLHRKDSKFGSSVFERTKDDDKTGMSHEDRIFMQQMDKEFQIDSTGHWVAPLPFKSPRPPLPNNKPQAKHRAQLLDANLKKNTRKREHFLEFMAKILDNHHAEVAPPLAANEECWYLPLFGVYHPRKPDQIRGVFDSSAKHQGVSLNDVLLTGPDLINNLIGVLLRFRREMVAVTADVQHMFHCFIVREDHRNYLRFFWYENNDINKKLIEYRMKVHVFGNSPSPAVATLGLRKAALKAEPEYGRQVTSFVSRDFYVDDGLTSCSTPEEAVKLLVDTQSALKDYGNLRLHKIASNSTEVMAAFPTTDLASNLKDLDLDSEEKPLQRSLGLIWDVNADKFLFELSSNQKPITRRGILSTINSIFDPLGFLSPVIIYGKLILRDIVLETIDWDEPVSDEIASKWESWKNTLEPLKNLRISRTYVPELSKCITRELHVYSDASEKAIAAVVYLRTKDVSNHYHVGFVIGKAKVAPQTGTTIPRKELCAAVLAVEIAQFAIEHLDIKIDNVRYYTDSKVVLGYICNSTRRFHVYVANRVEKIRKFSDSDQWNYVPTDQNPSDSATRSIQAVDLKASSWLNGPQQLFESTPQQGETHELIMPNDDIEIRTAFTTVDPTKVNSSCSGLGTARFERSSSWKRLIAAINHLRLIARQRKCGKSADFKVLSESHVSEDLILRAAQGDFYGKEVTALQMGEQISKRSPLIKLNPRWDTTRKILRVGGRLEHSKETIEITKPIIVPGNSHIATLLVRHYHEKVKHQGRHITEGAIRSAGYWITSGKRLTSRVIHKCVICRMLRREPQHQIMADLPSDRLEPGPPFTNVGVDVFGPWEVIARKTRGGSANSKRWAVLFTCLVIRAVHIEVIEEMSSSSFINALRRFQAIYGPVKLFRSDQGTNFVGAVDDLKINHGPLKNYLLENRTEWKFNPPHSSHMGGAWERMIGTARRILDAMLAESPSRKFLTHEVLSTFMAEVCAIINSRPLTPVSTDPENPLILTPAILLTQKTNYAYKSDELGDTCPADLYRSQWKRVQALARTFWSRWMKEYLPLLQSRRKWTFQQRNLTEGDVVLMRDSSVCRNQWPVGIVTRAIKGSDDHVRKADVRIVVGDKCEPKIYTRPITELILLID